jgi:peptide deformylase
VEFLNERAEPVRVEAEGWYARILQHEIDHLNGIIYIDRMYPQTFSNMENYDRLWKGLPTQHALKELSVG